MQAKPSLNIFNEKPNDDPDYDLGIHSNHQFGIHNEINAGKLVNLISESEKSSGAVTICKPVRIMVVGRAGSGKTTLIRLVVGDNGPKTGVSFDRNVIDVEWPHPDPDLPLVFHDSNGIDVNGENRVEAIGAFLDAHLRSEDLSQKIHLVWYVFSALDRRLADDGGLLQMLEARYPELPVLFVMTFNDYGEKVVRKTIDSPNSGFEMLLQRVLNPGKRQRARDTMVRLGNDVEEMEDGSIQGQPDPKGLQTLLQQTKNLIGVRESILGAVTKDPEFIHITTTTDRPVRDHESKDLPKEEPFHLIDKDLSGQELITTHLPGEGSSHVPTHHPARENDRSVHATKDLQEEDSIYLPKDLLPGESGNYLLGEDFIRAPTDLTTQELTHAIEGPMRRQLVHIPTKDHLLLHQEFSHVTKDLSGEELIHATKDQRKQEFITPSKDLPLEEANNMIKVPAGEDSVRLSIGPRINSKDLQEAFIYPTKDPVRDEFSHTTKNLLGEDILPHNQVSIINEKLDESIKCIIKKLKRTVRARLFDIIRPAKIRGVDRLPEKLCKIWMIPTNMKAAIHEELSQISKGIRFDQANEESATFMPNFVFVLGVIMHVKAQMPLQEWSLWDDSQDFSQICRDFPTSTLGQKLHSFLITQRRNYASSPNKWYYDQLKELLLSYFKDKLKTRGASVSNHRHLGGEKSSMVQETLELQP